MALQYETRHSDPALDMKKQVPQIISTLTLDVVFKSKSKVGRWLVFELFLSGVFYLFNSSCNNDTK